MTTADSTGSSLSFSSPIYNSSIREAGDMSASSSCNNEGHTKQDIDVSLFIELYIYNKEMNLTDHSTK